ncbi:MAG: helix-turn-helix domain-containing protein [Candidatus Zixiibacteriota bacterium]
MNQDKITFGFDDEDRANPIGSILRYQREQRKLDLVNISEELKVKLDYLQAMEQGRFDLLPSGFYRRSFLKAYAEYLKLDMDEMLRVLDEEEAALGKGGAKPLTMPKIPLVETPREETIQKPAPVQGLCPPVRPPPRGTPASFAFAVFLGLIIGAACLIFLFKGGEGEYHEAATGLSMAETESLEVIPEPPDTMELFMRLLDEKIGSAPELILRIEAAGRSWIRVTSDEVELYTGFINESMNAEFKARESLSINLGVNEGIKAFLNGFEMKPLEKGVTYLDRGNFTEFIPTDRANELVQELK